MKCGFSTFSITETGFLLYSPHMTVSVVHKGRYEDLPKKNVIPRTYSDSSVAPSYIIQDALVPLGFTYSLAILGLEPSAPAC